MPNVPTYLKNSNKKLLVAIVPPSPVIYMGTTSQNIQSMRVEESWYGDFLDIHDLRQVPRLHLRGLILINGVNGGIIKCICLVLPRLLYHIVVVVVVVVVPVYLVVVVVVEEEEVIVVLPVYLIGGGKVMMVM